MSSDNDVTARAPKRERGKRRVAELLEAATAVFAEKGFEAATMTEIAARAGAPIGSLYQFFPVKEVLAETVVRNYAALLQADLVELEGQVAEIDIATLVERLFALLRSHPAERAAAAPLVERMDKQTRRATFRHMLRKHLVSIVRARATALSSEESRDLAIVLLQMMKAYSSLSDEDGLPGRPAAMRELQAMTLEYLQKRLG